MLAGILDATEDRGLLLCLRRFHDAPFSEKSIGFVAETLPSLAFIYKVLAKKWSTFERPASFHSCANVSQRVFQCAVEHMGERFQVDQDVTVMQVNVVEEWLRDALDKYRSTESSVVIFEEWETAEALRCLRFHDAVLLTLAGIYEVDIFFKKIQFRLTPAGKKSMRQRRWAMYLERMSGTAVRENFKQIVQLLRYSGQTESIVDLVSPQLWRQLEDYLMDRYFSLTRGAEEKYPQRAQLKRLRPYCRWFAALEISRSAGETSIHATDERLERLGLDRSLLNEILAHRARAPLQDRGIYQNGQNLTLGSAAIEHAIGVVKEVALSNTVHQQLTEWLQEIFLSKYLSDYIGSDYYIIGKGGVKDVQPPGAGQAFDCDFVFYERARGIFFFAQSKMSRISRLATIGDEINFLLKEDGELAKGLRQIRAFREKIHEKYVLDKVQSAFPGMKIGNLTNRSHFIVLHTMPELNGLEVDGIIFYEWNAFRNLLRRGSMQRTDLSGENLVRVREVQAASTLPLERVDAIYKHFCVGGVEDYIKMEQIIQHAMNGLMEFPLSYVGRFLKFFRKQREVVASMPWI